MKKFNLKFLIILVILALVLVLPFGCKGKTQEKSETASKMGGVLVFGRSGDAVGLDPAREDDGESFMVCDNIYETLVQFKPGTTELEPGLAESWTVSQDGLEFTFKLRKGVLFHDGTKFNADAVIFSIKRQLDKNHPYYKYGPWKYWGYMDMDNIIKDVIKIDDYTVKFTLKKPEAPFLADLAMNFASIVSPTAAMKYKEDFKNHPVGTGPFKFVSWEKDSNIVLERWEKYWGQKAYLDKVVFKVIPDPTARFLALQKGEVDIIDFPSPEDLDKIYQNPELKTVEQPGLNVGYLAMNCMKEPFNNKLVRQAMNYAVDKQAIIKAVYGRMGIPAKNPLPPTMWAYNDNIKDYPFDIEKAKELLKQAGLENGFKTTLWAMPVSRPYNPNGRKVAEILQAQFAKIGVQAEIVTYEWGTYLDKTDHGEHDMALLGWTGDNGDPDNFLWVLLSAPSAEPPAGNIAFWKNQEFTDLIKQAKETYDINKRKELYFKAQEIFHEEAPWVVLAHSRVIEPMKKTVMGFVLYPTGKRVFHFVWIKKTK